MFERKWVITIDEIEEMTSIGRYSRWWAWQPTVQLPGVGASQVRKALQLADVGVRPIGGRVPLVYDGFGVTHITVGDDRRGYEPQKLCRVGHALEARYAFA